MACCFCGASLEIILDFGEVALAGAFLSKIENEQKYRMRIGFCPECFGVQVVDPVDPKLLFRDYKYFSSSNPANVIHFKKYAEHLVDEFKPRRVLEIGSNDGVLLRPLRSLGVNVVGVEPAVNVVEQDTPYSVYNTYFNWELATSIGKFDIVVANNVFAHMDKIHDTLKAIRRVMHKDSLFVMEAHYLPSLIKQLQYDDMYHEHRYYYSVLSLKNLLLQHEMSLVDVEYYQIRGGTMRYYIALGDKKPSEAVVDAVVMEYNMGLDKLETYKTFASHVAGHKTQLRRLVGKFHFDNVVAGYGASGRSNSLTQYAALPVDFIVDDAKEKHGLITPGMHCDILPVSELKKADMIVMFAWPFFEQVKDKCLGKPVFMPFPWPMIVETT
jgi:SAM-dependent methyltransferase